MPLYLIKRDVTGLSDADLDAAGYRAAACAYHYDGLRWLTSYLDKAAQRLYCIYEAVDAEQLFDHSRRSLIPCDEVVEVAQIFAENFFGGTEEGALAGGQVT